eukprot:767771-Hanusia_phi.AAC.1
MNEVEELYSDKRSGLYFGFLLGIVQMGVDDDDDDDGDDDDGDDEDGDDDDDDDDDGEDGGGGDADAIVVGVGVGVVGDDHDDDYDDDEDDGDGGELIVLVVWLVWDPWWSLAVGGALVGYITNLIAIKVGGGAGAAGGANCWSRASSSLSSP